MYFAIFSFIPYIMYIKFSVFLVLEVKIIKKQNQEKENALSKSNHWSYKVPNVWGCYYEYSDYYAVNPFLANH